MKVLFIGGTGRSGSNVLRARLAEHSQIASLPFESRFTVDPGGVLATYRALAHGASPFEMHNHLTRMARLLHRLAHKSPLDQLAGIGQRLMRRLGIESNLRTYADWELERHIPGFSQHVTRLNQDLTTATYPAIWPGRIGLSSRAQTRLATSDIAKLDMAFSAFLTACFTSIQAASNGTTVVDDNTYNLFFAPELTHLLPEAHLVHILRDPRDVVASVKHQRWAPTRLEDLCAFYDGSMSTILHNLSQSPRDRQFQIRLEDLARAPMPIMETLHSRIGLTPERSFSPSDFSGAHSGRWRDDFDAAEQNYVNRTLAPWIERFGYDA